MKLSRLPSEPSVPRIAELARLPIFLALAGKRAVISGGNAAAAWKAELLSAAGAEVDVYAPSPCEELAAIAEEARRGTITIHARALAPGDCAGASVAVAAIEDDGEAQQFAGAMRAAGILVNVIDKPDFSDFAFGAIVNRSPLVIGVSTDGAAPVFAQAIRARLERTIPRGFSRWAEAARTWRPQIDLLGLPFRARRRLWERFTDRAVDRPDHQPGRADLDQLIEDLDREDQAVRAGAVVLVAAGPGDPELLTLRAVRALQSADVILIDDLVAPEILDFARREAKKMMVRDSGHGNSRTAEEITTLMIGLAKAGRRVVRLNGGDPALTRRAAEIAACRAAGVSLEIVPGVTAVPAPPGEDNTGRRHAGPAIVAAE